MPQCMCVDCDILIFLRNGALTSDGKPYIVGHVTQVLQLSSGGIQVTFTYDDATLPTEEIDEEDVPIEISFGEDGTACDPDCFTDCSWASKVLSLLENATIAGLQNRHYILYQDDEPVADGSFNLPRIPFTPGFRLTSVRITCFTYNANTEGTFNLKVGATTIASFEGTLEEQRVLVLVPGLELIAYDAMPVLECVDVAQTVYEAFALGLVIELIGVLGA